MMNEKKTNKVIGALVIAIAFFTLVALGSWQVQRLVWKTNLIANIEKGLASAPVTLDGEKNYAEYTRVFVEGSFINSKEMYLHAINSKGEAGYDVYVPFVSTEGYELVVNRGFVPPSFLSPHTRLSSTIDEKIKLSGVLRRSAVKKYFIPENDPNANRWFYADLKAMQQWANLDPNKTFNMILELELNPDAKTPPFGEATKVKVVNNHLGYAVTWFGLAFSLLVVVYFFRRKKPISKGDNF